MDPDPDSQHYKIVFCFPLVKVKYLSSELLRVADMDLYSFVFLNMNPYSYTRDPGPGVKIFYFKSENSTFLENCLFHFFLS